MYNTGFSSNSGIGAFSLLLLILLLLHLLLLILIGGSSSSSWREAEAWHLDCGSACFCSAAEIAVSAIPAAITSPSPLTHDSGSRQLPVCLSLDFHRFTNQGQYTIHIDRPVRSANTLAPSIPTAASERKAPIFRRRPSRLLSRPSVRPSARADLTADDTLRLHPVLELFVPKCRVRNRTILENYEPSDMLRNRERSSAECVVKE